VVFAIETSNAFIINHRRGNRESLRCTDAADQCHQAAGGGEWGVVVEETEHVVGV
jgi:hypothetical protein